MSAGQRGGGARTAKAAKAKAKAKAQAKAKAKTKAKAAVAKTAAVAAAKTAAVAKTAAGALLSLVKAGEGVGDKGSSAAEVSHSPVTFHRRDPAQKKRGQGHAPTRTTTAAPAEPAHFALSVV